MRPLAPWWARLLLAAAFGAAVWRALAPRDVLDLTFFALAGVGMAGATELAFRTPRLLRLLAALAAYAIPVVLGAALGQGGAGLGVVIGVAAVSAVRVAQRQAPVAPDRSALAGGFAFFTFVVLGVALVGPLATPLFERSGQVQPEREAAYAGSVVFALVLAVEVGVLMALLPAPPKDGA